MFIVGISNISKLFPGMTSALLAEILAAQEIVLLVKELRRTYFVLEGDSIVVKKSLLDGDADHSIPGHLLENTRLTLENCRNFDIHWISRKCNNVALTLAQHAKVVGSCSWSDPSMFLVQALEFNSDIS
ncbi:hypothetical protein ACH5RR_006943 [Cinchona calisaya]|uniref:RNase H type-1 domain-containing protein n=1 Tax=Cinchona calisaya TaxID=153742 RepID=A0ABD3AQD7_9GENT